MESLEYTGTPAYTMAIDSPCNKKAYPGDVQCGYLVTPGLTRYCISIGRGGEARVGGEKNRKIHVLVLVSVMGMFW